MSEKSKTQKEAAAPQQDSLTRENEEFIEKVRSMSSEKFVGYLVSAGINKADGGLTKDYK